MKIQGAQVRILGQSIAFILFLLQYNFDRYMCFVESYLRFGEWGSWSACSQPCGKSGTRVRIRGCVILPKGESQTKNLSSNSTISPETSSPTSFPDKEPEKQNSSTGQHNLTHNQIHPKQERHTGGMSYEDVLRTEYEHEKLAQQQSETKKIVKQIYPAQINSQHVKRLYRRNVKTKHYHKIHLKREAHPPLLNTSNLPMEAKVLRKCSAHGTVMISRCNVRSCPGMLHHFLNFTEVCLDPL
jgi:hypothetical protein